MLYVNVPVPPEAVTAILPSVAVEQVNCEPL